MSSNGKANGHGRGKKNGKHHDESSNPLVVIKASAIHGRGLFARCDISRGTLIGSYEGKRTKNDGKYVLWLEDDAGDAYGINGRNETRYVNHSSRPNAVFEGPSLLAIRKITAGEEITHHYGDDWRS